MADLPKPTAKTRRSESTLVVGSESQARRSESTLVVGSESQARASRQNGARSRGPRSAAGKARSARNAVTHGLRSRRLVLLDDENAAELRAFAAALQAELAPEGRLQADLVGRIVMAAWRARRADKLEAGLLGAYLTADPADPDPRAAFGTGLIRDNYGPRAFATLVRYRGSVLAEWFRSLAALKRLQAETQGRSTAGRASVGPRSPVTKRTRESAAEQSLDSQPQR